MNETNENFNINQLKPLDMDSAISTNVVFKELPAKEEFRLRRSTKNQQDLQSEVSDISHLNEFKSTKDASQHSSTSLSHAKSALKISQKSTKAINAFNYILLLSVMLI